MIRVFILYENFDYMAFIRHSAGKIWSPICIQDIVYYTLSGSSGTTDLTRFLYLICRTSKSDEDDYFYVQNIKNPLKHLWWRYIIDIDIAWNPLTISTKSSILSNRLDSKYYTPGISKVTLYKCTRTVPTQKWKANTVRKTFFLVEANSYSQKRLFLNF